MIKNQVYHYATVGMEIELTRICKAVPLAQYLDLETGSLKNKYSLNKPREDVENLIDFYTLIKGIEADILFLDQNEERILALEKAVALEDSVKEILIREIPHYLTERSYPISIETLPLFSDFCEQYCADYLLEIQKLDLKWLQETLRKLSKEVNDGKIKESDRKAYIDHAMVQYEALGHSKEDFYLILNLVKREEFDEKRKTFYVAFDHLNEQKNGFLTIRAISREQASGIFAQLYGNFQGKELYTEQQWNTFQSKAYADPTNRISIDSDCNIVNYDRFKNEIHVEPYRNDILNPYKIFPEIYKEHFISKDENLRDEIENEEEEYVLS